jgi:hypothetical protein
MTILRALPLSLFFVTLACHSAPSTDVAKKADAPATAEQDADKQKQEADEKRAKEREIAHKRRDLEYAKIGLQTNEIERRMRTMSIEAQLHDAEVDLQKQRKELELHQKETAPRELEEHLITLDYQTHRAEESKEELAELESMYKDDEFASKTKELVIKRGRRQAEMADRNLAVGRREFEVFKSHTMPEREKDLQKKVRDAEMALEKSRMEKQKSMMELDVQQRQAMDKVKDLEEEIAELERKLAEGKK